MAFATVQQKLSRLLDPEVSARIDALPRDNLNAFGVDPFGYDPKVVKQIAPLLVWLRRHYFRCEVEGLEAIPEKGRFLLVGNHSGQLPFDAAMIGTTVLCDAPHPRLVRGMVERWSAELPWVSSLFVRAGQVVGDPTTCARLLEADEGVMVFPEGARGINKLFAQRYQLASFGTGFMRLALQTRAPIIPFALVGAEEQAPALADITPLARLFGFPSMPLVFPQILPFPLPVKYHIRFGEPLSFDGSRNDDDNIVAQHVKKVRNMIQRMIEDLLEKRPGIFR